VCCCGGGGRGCLGSGATGSRRCRCGSRRSTRGGTGRCGCCCCCCLSLYTWHTSQACQSAPQVATVAAVSSRHKVWPRPLLCFSRSTTAVTTQSLVLKARASAPLPELLPPTTSDCVTKGGASAHRVGSSSALGNACDARFRTFPTPSPQVSSRPPTHFPSTGTHAVSSFLGSRDHSIRHTYGWTGQETGSGLSDRPRAILGQIHF
jgi:hypothetical protein